MACARESGVMSTFNFPFLFFGLGRSSVNHGYLFCLSCSVCARAVVPSPALLSCPFSCCAVRAPSSSLPAELTRPFFFCTSSTDPTHYSTPSRSLSGTLHIVPSTSLCVVSLDRSVAFPVQSLQRTEFIRHIFLIRFLSFLSFFLFSSSSLAQSTRIWRGY